MMINSHKKLKYPILKKKELPQKIKETVILPKKGQIDIRRVKYFIKHVVTAHTKISERNKANTELKDHLDRLRDVPGIGKTRRVGEALNELEEKIHNALQKEKELMMEHKEETDRVKLLTKEAELLRRRIKELERKTVKKEEEPIKRIKDIKSILQLEKQIKELEDIHNKFKKVKKHQKEAKLIQSKINILKDRLKKARS